MSMSSSADGNEKRPVTDDLVNRLSIVGIGAAHDFSPSEVMVRWELVVEATRRIEEQSAEIERLRAAANELAEALRDARRRHQCDCVDGYDERTGAAALAAWEKVQSVEST